MNDTPNKNALTDAEIKQRDQQLYKELSEAATRFFEYLYNVEDRIISHESLFSHGFTKEKIKEIYANDNFNFKVQDLNILFSQDDVNLGAAYKKFEQAYINATLEKSPEWVRHVIDQSYKLVADCYIKNEVTIEPICHKTMLNEISSEICDETIKEVIKKAIKNEEKNDE